MDWIKICRRNVCTVKQFFCSSSFSLGNSLSHLRPFERHPDVERVRVGLRHGKGDGVPAGRHHMLQKPNQYVCPNIKDRLRDFHLPEVAFSQNCSFIFCTLIFCFRSFGGAEIRPSLWNERRGEKRRERLRGVPQRGGEGQSLPLRPGSVQR